MKKLIKILGLVTLVGILAVALIGCGTTSNKDSENQNSASPNNTEATDNADKPKTVTIGFQVAAGDILLNKAKGWFAEELSKKGIELKYVQFNAGRDINNAMLAGSIDFGDLGNPPASIAVTKGIPYQVFWISNIIGEAEALAVKNSANIKSLKDLKGKKIATTVSSTSHYSLLNALKLEGIEPKDVNIVDLNPTDIVAAWQRGDIDAAYTWQPNLGKLLQDGHLVITSKEVAEKGAVTANLNIVRSEFAEKYPEIVSLYVKSLNKAYDLYKNNPDEAAEALAKELAVDKGEAGKQANEVIWLTAEEELTNKYLGTSASKGDFVKALKATGDFLVEQKALENTPDISAYEKAVNPKFIEDALKK